MTGRSHPKNVLITGGAKGLGRAFCRQLSEKNCRLHVIDHDYNALQALKNELTTEMKGYVCDLADLDRLDRELDILMRSGPFDLVIFNAGINATGRFESIPQVAHRKLIRVNLIAPMAMTSRLLENQAVAKSGGVVFISSLSHAVGYPGAASYAASKDGLAIYAKSIRKPLQELEISVTCAFPGPIDTGHAERHAPADAQAENRMPPEEMAHLILKGAMAGKSSLYPGLLAKAIGIAGWLAPARTTKFMREMIYEKLDREVF